MRQSSSMSFTETLSPNLSIAHKIPHSLITSHLIYGAFNLYAIIFDPWTILCFTGEHTINAASTSHTWGKMNDPWWIRLPFICTVSSWGSTNLIQNDTQYNKYVREFAL